MITEVVLVYNDPNQLERIKGESFNGSPFFTFIDESSLKSRKKAFKVKNHFAARATPFAAVYDGDKPIKAFYTEADSDIIKSLITYLNENLCS